MKIKQWSFLVVVAMTAMMAITSRTRADDAAAGAKEEAQKVEKRVLVVAQAGGTHWIGVLAVPVDAALKSQLGLDEDRLIVRQVIDDSPANKAGVQVHDILLKFGDTSITTLEQLLKAVEQSADKETSLEVIRGGKKQSLQVTAEPRPENQSDLDLQVGVDVDVSYFDDVIRGTLGTWFKNHGPHSIGGGPLRFRVVGPGVVDSHVDAAGWLGTLPTMPKNLSIEIKRDGDAPAQIKVTRDGETWDVTEENLDVLPEDVRPHIQHSLGGFGFGPRGQGLRLKALQIHPGVPAVQFQPGVQVQPGQALTPAVRAFQVRRQAKDTDLDVEQLRKDVDELKATVKKLQADRPKKNKKDGN